MSIYRHKVNNFHRKKLANRMKRSAQVLVVVLVLISGYIAVDWLRNELSTSDSVTTVQNTSSVQAASASVYRTDYFQFQAPEEWVYVSSQSTDKKFVYIKNDNQLVTERFIVFVDRPVVDRESDMSLTHVLPVEMIDGQRLKLAEISDHCGEAEGVARTAPNQRIVLNGASFFCNSASKQYNVIVSEIDGDEGLEFVRESGEKVNLTLIYSDLTAYPSAGDIDRIVSSFQVL